MRWVFGGGYVFCLAGVAGTILVSSDIADRYRMNINTFGIIAFIVLGITGAIAACSLMGKKIDLPHSQDIYE